MSTVEREAFRYARAGIPVLPVSGKLPLTKNGLTDATTQEGKLGFWFRNYKEAGVGLACGHPLRSGGHLVVFDVDVKNDGDYHLGELEGERGGLPETWTVRTPSGGWHYYYKTPEPFKTRVGFRPGLELRGIGTYVVAPPSPGYRVETPAQIDQCPEWLIKVANTGVDAGLAPALTETIPEGRRDATLTSLAGTLRARGLVAEEILPTLMAVNQRRCDPELPECDVVRIAKSVARLAIVRPLVEAGK
jgi:hypothetical protein